MTLGAGSAHVIAVVEQALDYCGLDVVNAWATCNRVSETLACRSLEHLFVCMYCLGQFPLSILRHFQGEARVWLIKSRQMPQSSQQAHPWQVERPCNRQTHL